MLQNVSRILSMVYQVFYLRYAYKMDFLSGSPDSSTSEVTTLQLEFRDLGRCIDEDSNFEEAAAKISNIIHKLDKTEGEHRNIFFILFCIVFKTNLSYDIGLVPIFINANSGKFRKHSTITFGARGDSYYEYLLKQWIQTGKSIDFLKEDFLEAMKGVSLFFFLNFKVRYTFCWEIATFFYFT